MAAAWAVACLMAIGAVLGTGVTVAHAGDAAGGIHRTLLAIDVLRHHHHDDDPAEHQYDDDAPAEPHEHVYIGLKLLAAPSFFALLHALTSVLTLVAAAVVLSRLRLLTLAILPCLPRVIAPADPPSALTRLVRVNCALLH